MKTAITPKEAITALIDRGWKVAQIAAHCSMHRANVGRIYAGATQPTFENGRKLLDLAASRRKPPKGKLHASR